MFLGIMVLILSVLVVYFESKLRVQNHKIASMFSLVSSLANDLIKDKQPPQVPNAYPFSNSNNFPLNGSGNGPFVFKNDLIEVSDNEQEDEDDLSENDDDLSENEEDASENEEDASETDTKNNKITLLENKDNTGINLFEELDELDELDKIDQLDETSVLNETSNAIDVTNELLQISSSDLKTININLEDTTTTPNEETQQNNSVDYKKMPLSKLRTIVVEKQLATDASKFKKNEILKLLNIET